MRASRIWFSLVSTLSCTAVETATGAAELAPVPVDACCVAPEEAIDALELAPEGVTVNAVHPDAVFDTRLWTPEALATSAARYGLTIDEYKTRNLLKAEIKSRDVALAVCAFIDGTLPATTGAQLPVDGGNDRVI